jgi:catechol 2,3-dioxygenase-like lactoylglutathione lyase family enzyme
MLHHISIGVRDVAQAAEFYDAVFAALGYKRVMEFLPHAIAYGDKSPSFWVQLPRGQQELTVSNGTHIAIAAFSQAAVHAFYDAALAKGGLDDGAPGPRPEYSPDYYASFVIDPDGNRLEAVLTPKPAAAKAAPKKKKAKKAKKAVAKAAPAKKPAKKTKKVVKKAAKKVAKPAPKKAGKKVVKKDKKKGGKKGKKK